MCEDVGRDWQAKELCGESGRPFQRPVDSRVRLSTWRGVRRDESDGVGTRKAPQRPAGGSLLTGGEFMKLVPVAACFITALFVIWEAIEFASHRHGAITAKVTRLVASLLMFVPAGFLAHSLG